MGRAARTPRTLSLSEHQKERARAKVRRSAVWSLLALSLGLSACQGLPADFESLPLVEKIAAYEKYLERVGQPNRTARGLISWHGHPAKDAMVKYVLGEDSGMPRREAILIVQLGQDRGCSLRNTRVEAALRVVATDDAARQLDQNLANQVLESIRLDRHVEFGLLDLLPKGPCNEGIRPPPPGSSSPKT